MPLSKSALRREKKRLLAERDKKIKEIRKSELYLNNLMFQEWKPLQFKVQRDKIIQDLISQKQAGFISEEEFQAAKKRAKADYEDNKKKFMNSKARIAEIEAKYENADAMLTATEHASIYNYETNNNILIFGGSGCGKTRRFLMPNVLQAHSSFVITDPKGEILAKAGRFLEEVKGYKIRVLNLDELSKSDCYNPLAYIHPERDGYEERVISLIDTIIMNTNGDNSKGSSDPFWEQAEKCFLQALFFFTVCCFEKPLRNISTMLGLMGLLEMKEEGDNKDSKLDKWVNETAVDLMGEDHIGIQQWREFRSKASGKTALSIVMTSVARFAPFRTKEVSRILSADSMNLERLGEEKMAIFVVVAPTGKTFSFMAGMLFTQMFQELQYCATQVHKADGQRLPVMVRFLLDEFYNTCRIPQFEQIIAYARSFGIGICPIVQSLKQLEEIYEKSWKSIVDNCSYLLYLGNVTNDETLEYVVKLIGKGTFDKKSTSRSRGKNGSNSTSFDKIGRELLDTSELRQLPKDDCILVVTGRPVFWSKKYDYQSHPNYMYTSDASKAYYYDYTPQKVLTPEEQMTADKLSLRKDSQEAEKMRKQRDLAEQAEQYKRDLKARYDEVKERVTQTIEGINRKREITTALGDSESMAIFARAAKRNTFAAVSTTELSEQEAYELLNRPQADDTDYSGMSDSDALALLESPIIDNETLAIATKRKQSALEDVEATVPKQLNYEKAAVVLTKAIKDQSFKLVSTSDADNDELESFFDDKTNRSWIADTAANREAVEKAARQEADAVKKEIEAKLPRQATEDESFNALSEGESNGTIIPVSTESFLDNMLGAYDDDVSDSIDDMSDLSSITSELSLDGLSE